MWSEFISQKTNQVLNYLFVKKEKNAIIDPFAGMVRLAILNYKPKGTKIGFQDNKISFHEPCILQGTIRWSQGDNREDLHNLFQPIKKALQWYDTTDDSVRFIFSAAKAGLEKLQKSYTYNSLITHSLQLYINYIQGYLSSQRSRQAPEDSEAENKLFSQLKDLWTENEIKIIYNILNELNNTTKENYISLVDALESIISHKERKVNELIKEYTTLLE